VVAELKGACLAVQGDCRWLEPSAGDWGLAQGSMGAVRRCGVSPRAAAMLMLMLMCCSRTLSIPVTDLLLTGEGARFSSLCWMPLLMKGERVDVEKCVLYR